MSEQQKGPALDEQETTFTIEATDRNTVYVFSNDLVWQRRMARLGIEPYRTDGYGMFYKVSLDTFGFGFRAKRQLTDEQRQALSDRLAAMRAEGRAIDDDDDVGESQ